jgi:hypothetical protein
MEKISLAEKLSLLAEHWRPEVEDPTFTAPTGVRI